MTGENRELAFYPRLYLTLFLDRGLPRIFLPARCQDVFVQDLITSFCFVSSHLRAKVNLQRCGDVFFDILITSKGASALSMF